MKKRWRNCVLNCLVIVSLEVLLQGSCYRLNFIGAKIGFFYKPCLTHECPCDNCHKRVWRRRRLLQWWRPQIRSSASRCFRFPYESGKLTGNIRQRRATEACDRNEDSRCPWRKKSLALFLTWNELSFLYLGAIQIIRDTFLHFSDPPPPLCDIPIFIITVY